jgi:hypothetical protein
MFVRNADHVQRVGRSWLALVVELFSTFTERANISELPQ